MRWNPIFYFDLDGVLADFDTTYTKLTGTTYPHDASLTDEQKNEKWAMLDAHPNFFRDLPWIPGSRSMVAFAMKHAKQSIGVLSAASRRIPQSPAQKHEWCKREMPWIPTQNIIIVNRKSEKLKYVGPGHILVDDLDINVERWQQAGGIGILFKNAPQALAEIQAIIQAPEGMYRRMLQIVEEECR